MGNQNPGPNIKMINMSQTFIQKKHTLNFLSTRNNLMKYDHSTTLSYGSTQITVTICVDLNEVQGCLEANQDGNEVDTRPNDPSFHHLK